MKNFRKSTVFRTLWTLTTAAVLVAAASAAQAQEWPSKPVRIVVGGPAGGTADALARIVAEGLGQSTGKPVIVEAKPGAAGAIAVSELLKTPHDGHTLLLIQGGIVTETPQAYPVSYKPFTDLKPLVQVSQQGLILLGNANLAPKNLKELVAHIKSQKGGMDYASYATGMRGHTSGVQFARLAKVELKHIGYKGSPPALQDVMGGHVPLMFDGPATALPLIKAGKVKAFAVNFPTRITALPDVPTFTELGYPALNGGRLDGLVVNCGLVTRYSEQGARADAAIPAASQSTPAHRGHGHGSRSAVDAG